MKTAFSVCFCLVSALVMGEVTEAKAVLNPTKGNEVRGTVQFIKTETGVRVIADIDGLIPGEHGFHIHEFGDCTAQDGSSAGGHFNPDKQQHGSPDSASRHVGDLGNITADAAGKVHLDKVFSGVSLNGDATIVGRAVIVHEKADDFVTQPTGNAGGRLACGIIVAAEPATDHR